MILATSLPRFKPFLGGSSPCTCALLVLAAFVLQRGRLSVSACARSIRSDVRDAGNLLRFLAGSREPAVLLRQAQQALLAEALGQGGVWVLAVDSTQHGQQGRKTENTFSRANVRPRARKGNRKQKQYHQKSCHTFVVAVLLSPQGVRIPFWLPYYTRDYAAWRRVDYQTQAQLAARLIRALPVPDATRVVVVGDTAFEADSVRQACQERGWDWVTPVNPERVFAGDKPRPKVLSLPHRLQADDFTPVTLRLDRGPYAAQRRLGTRRARHAKHERTYWVHARTAEVHHVGRVLLLFSTTQAPKAGEAIKVQKVLVSSAAGADVAEVLAWYGLRWQVELFFKECKGELGLCRYKFQRFCKVERWVSLCLVTFCYLEWYRLQRLREGQAKARGSWQAARCHACRQAVVQEIEEEDLRQIYEWACDGKGLARLQQVLRAAYGACSSGQEDG
jgi:DDE family transposase